MVLSLLTAQASPLSEQQIQQLQGLISQLNPIQQAWVSGYLAASAQQLAGQTATPPQNVSASAVLTILYGSQTGNARHLAEQIAVQAQQQGLNVKVVDLADYKTSQLKNEKYLLIVTSTYGEGEPPENADSFYKFLYSKKAPELKELKYAVLGLGDTSYEFFCKTAQDFDQRLTELGAQVFHPRAELDVDYNDAAKIWSEQLVAKLEPELKTQAGESAQVIAWPGQTSGSQYNKQHPFAAELYTCQKITGRHSTKDVRHIELSLADSGLRYQPGDALGVYFSNASELVAELLQHTQIQPDELVRLGEQSLSIAQALADELELTQSYPAFVEKYAVATSNAALSTLAQDKTALRHYLAERQIIDIVREYPAKLSAQQLADALRKQQPRLYSIASSQAEVEDEVHLTVGVVRYDAFGLSHTGGASGFLADRLTEGDKVKVFVEKNDNFRLPQSDDTAIIMVGPGTGIAPFRAFLQEREQRGASGKNWLFFGNPHFTQDFLYQTELQNYLKTGVLTHLHVAFSREQAEKVYVQDKIRLYGADVFHWLEQGAHLYICGDANRMAKDVHHALLDIIQQYGGKSAEEAQDYLEQLRAAKRYQKDVY